MCSSIRVFYPVSNNPSYIQFSFICLFFLVSAPKSSPAFYEQKQRLERAKTGDYLKHKIQRRPHRDELVHQHILEQEVFDPSYYEQERKLKRARLADDLNERLSHRPGPLELIKGNILHADLSLEQAIKEGQIIFKKTCEGEIIKNPPKRFVFEEESSSDSSTPSPSLNLSQQQNRLANAPYILSNTTPSASIVSIPTIEKEPPPTTVIPTVSYIVTTNVLQSSQPTNSTVYITTHPTTTAHSLMTSTNVASIQQPQVLSTINSGQNFGGSPKQLIKSIQQPEANAQISQPKSKKVKSKSTPKTRVIKFHEYTGPPNSGRTKNQTGWTSNPTTIETSYELLLKQQQLILQWQLESQQQQNSTNQQPIPTSNK
ncbi:RPEL repeat containing protein, partial [Euroglyphus maynei]